MLTYPYPRDCSAKLELTLLTIMQTCAGKIVHPAAHLARRIRAWLPRTNAKQSASARPFDRCCQNGWSSGWSGVIGAENAVQYAVTSRRSADAIMCVCLARLYANCYEVMSCDQDIALVCQASTGLRIALHTRISARYEGAQVASVALTQQNLLIVLARARSISCLGAVHFQSRRVASAQRHERKGPD